MKLLTHYLPALLFAGISFAGCFENQAPSDAGIPEVAEVIDLEQARKMIKEKTDRFTAAHISRDTAYLNNIVTSDARSFPPGSDIVSGRKAIADLNVEWVNYGIHMFEEKTTTFFGNEDFLIDEGYYFMRYGPDSTIDNGKYINIWTKEDGEWKICTNIWNAGLPISEVSKE